MPSGEQRNTDESAEGLLSRWQSHRADPTDSTTPAADADDSAAVVDEAPSVAKHAAAPLEPEERRSPGSATNSVAAGREIVEALRLTAGEPGTHAAVPTAAPPAPSAPPTPQAGRTPRPTTGRWWRPTPDPTSTTPAAPDPVSTSRHRGQALEVGPSTDVVFAPLLGVRRIVGLLMLVALVATAGAAYLAYDDPRPFNLGIAAILLAVTLVLYGVRASSSPVRLAIHCGQLEVVRGSRREVFDLTSRYARIEVVGTPGKRGWKVLFGRFGREPFLVDSSMVDAVAFTEALKGHRPNL